jgi:hypothetical protein
MSIENPAWVSRRARSSASGAESSTMTTLSIWVMALPSEWTNTQQNTALAQVAPVRGLNNEIPLTLSADRRAQKTARKRNLVHHAVYCRWLSVGIFPRTVGGYYGGRIAGNPFTLSNNTHFACQSQYCE